MTSENQVLEHNEASPSNSMEQLLRIYRIEPVGRFLKDRLRLPLPIVWFLFIALYFGVLFVMHRSEGTPSPDTLGDVFRAPIGPFYYPNLIGIAFDLIANPLFFVLLIHNRNLIPNQLMHLEESKTIVRRQSSSRWLAFLNFLGTNDRIQNLVAIFLPISIAVIGLASDILIYSPQGNPARYAVFLSFIGRYALVAVFVQIVYIFIILGNYRFNFRLHLNHPDRCSGLISFGKLALAGYFYLFLIAMVRAVASVTGGSSLEVAFKTVTGIGTLAYLWIVFPLTILFIFDQLLFKPHKSMERIQGQYLLNATAERTEYHHRIMSAITGFVIKSRLPLANEINFRFRDDYELLDTWAKLISEVEAMHTWPIPRITIAIIVVFLNPLVPILIPVVTEMLKRIFL